MRVFTAAFHLIPPPLYRCLRVDRSTRGNTDSNTCCTPMEARQEQRYKSSPKTKVNPLKQALEKCVLEFKYADMNPSIEFRHGQSSVNPFYNCQHLASSDLSLLQPHSMSTTMREIFLFSPVKIKPFSSPHPRPCHCHVS